MGNRKVSVTVEMLQDGSYALEFSQGLLSKQRGSTETIQGVLMKVSAYLKKQLGDERT